LKPGGSRTGGSAFSAGIVTAAAAATTGSTGVEAVSGSTAVAAILPATGAGTTLNPSVTATAITATTTAAVPTTPSIAAATPTAAIATAAGAAPTPTAAGGPGFSLVDAQRPSHQLGSLESLYGAVLALGIGHFNKREAPLASSFPLEGKGTGHDLAKGGEKFSDILLLSAEGEIAYENAHGRTRGDQRGKSKWRQGQQLTHVNPPNRKDSCPC